MVVEIVLVGAILALTAGLRKERRLKNRTGLLEQQTQTMSDFLLDNNDAYEPHEWTDAGKDTLARSRSPFSFEAVVVKLSICAKCKQTHRCIISGHNLARKRGLDHYEGFFVNGIKVPDKGCLPKKHE